MIFSIFMLSLAIAFVIERILMVRKYSAIIKKERDEREKLNKLVQRVYSVLSNSPELNNYDVDDWEAANLNDAVNEAVLLLFDTGSFGKLADYRDLRRRKLAKKVAW